PGEFSGKVFCNLSRLNFLTHTRRNARKRFSPVCQSSKTMNKENKTIYDFDFNLICEYFSNLERQGPGSPEATRKASGFIENLTDRSHIADIGCGTGGQT